MTTYLGALGSMVRIKCPSSLSTAFDRPASTRTTLGGRRTARLAARGHRAWSVSTGTASPLELAALQGFARGDFGTGPFWWLDPWAQQSNLLDPRDAALTQPQTGFTVAGPVALPGGPTVPAHLVHAGPQVDIVSGPFTAPQRGTVLAPVIPGMPVTLSAWVSSPSVTLRGAWREAGGASVASVQVSGEQAGWHRIHVTATPPTGVACIEVQVAGDGGMAAPAVTWTSGLRAYGAGAGARKTIVTGYSESVLAAWQGAMYSSQDYTILEVG